VDDAADEQHQQLDQGDGDVIASFTVDAPLLPVGADTHLHCRVTRVDGGSFVQVS